ncbi:MAG: hypothetical protein HZC28_04510 [Spirochaetes bacterium]|nr:hypothetical protein [Spirochaetota bacterium]
MENIFTPLIDSGRITDIAGLKKAYRRIALKTHPDRAGSDRYVEDFIRLKDSFREAEEYLQQKHEKPAAVSKIEPEPDHRFLFYVALKKIDALESPYYLDKDMLEAELAEANADALRHFAAWKGRTDLFEKAMREYGQLKTEKRQNTLAQLRKPLLYQNIKPVLFNIIYYHITASGYYRMQTKRIIAPVLRLLEQREMHALKEYMELLFADLGNDPAVFG